MRVSDEFNLWKMATYEEETIWKYITVQGWGKKIFIVEIIHKKFQGALQLSFGWKRKTCAPFSYFVQMNPLFEEKTKLFPLHEISFCICQILKGVSFAFSFQKKVPFIACKDFGQDAQNARVANWLRQCIESAIDMNAGQGGNVSIG